MKKIRTLTFVISIFFLVQINLFAQEKTTTSNSNNTEQSITLDESSLPINTADGNTNVSGVQNVNGVWVFVRMILVLGIVIGIIYLMFRFLRKKTNPIQENDPYLRKIAQLTLSPGKTVQVITLIDKAFLIGVADNSVNLISTIDDKDLIDSMNLYADKNQNSTKARSFADILDIFMPGGPRNKQNSQKSKNIFNGSAEQISKMLEEQRNRLNKENGE